MCGRFALKSPPAELIAHFGLDECADFKPQYNAAPSQVLPIIRQLDDGKRILSLAQWGLIPSWAKPDSKLPKPINAQTETVALKPMFRHAFRKGRVLVPADAFYEWNIVAERKQPMLIRLRSGEPIGLAGMVGHWQGEQGTLDTFTILTVPPNELVSQIHNRMPAIIWQRDYSHWLDPALTDVVEIHTMLTPYPSEKVEAWPVSSKVNNTRNDRPELMEPVTPNSR